MPPMMGKSMSCMPFFPPDRLRQLTRVTRVNHLLAQPLNRDLEDQGRNGTERAVAPSEETFGVVASDVFHVLASKACVGVVIGEDDVESQKGITHRDVLSAGGGSDQLAHRAPVRGCRQGCALHSMVGKVASKVGEGDLGTHDHAEV